MKPASATSLVDRQLKGLTLALDSAQVAVPESLHELARRCRDGSKSLLSSGRDVPADVLSAAGELLVMALCLAAPVEGVLQSLVSAVECLKLSEQTDDVDQLKLVSEDIQRQFVLLEAVSANHIAVESQNEESFESRELEAGELEELKINSLKAFFDEAREQLEQAEACLCSLATDSGNRKSQAKLLRHLHAFKGLAGFVGLNDISQVAHACEETINCANERQLHLNDDVIATLILAHDWLHAQLELIRTEWTAGLDPELRKPNTEILNLIDCCVPKLNRSAEASPKPSPPKREVTTTVAGAASETAALSETVSVTTKATTESTSRVGSKATTKATTPAINTVKIDCQKLDEFVDLIGELVLAESMLDAEIKKLCLATDSESHMLPKLRKISRELQARGLALRAVPIDGLFRRMSRVVFDLSRKTSKPTELVIEGGDTEIDKTIIDEVADPLMHLIRNSIDHGIESSTEDRVRAGKSAQAKVTLRAFHRSGSVFIEVEDDGRGLNRDRIRQKAIERGLITAEALLSDDEICRLIFLPGFSTAEKLTEISGRGVGMDVVSQNIQSLHGTVDIRSQEGQGTTISLRLPLTLAIMDGLVVRVGTDHFIVPISRVVQSIHPRDDQFVEGTRRSGLINIRGQHLPFCGLAELLGVPSSESESRVLILVEANQGTVGLLVDEMAGRQQFVLKSFGVPLPDARCFAGGTVMPDGRVGLILEIDALVALTATRTERALPND